MAEGADWFQSKLNGASCRASLRCCGNSWTTLRGDSDRALLLGSHLDSVPNGGWLDGCLGVLAGLEVLRGISEEFGGRPPITIRLVDWADEEGRVSAEASLALLHLPEPTLLRLIALARIAMEFVWRMPFGTVASMSNGLAMLVLSARNAAAYLELHIEQGPVLENMHLPLGVVLGTKGVERHAITFHGQEAHSGSTPMGVRRDALAAAAKLALEIRPIARRHPDAVATMGSVKTFPGIVTAVVGRCETTLDMRDLDAGVLASMLAEARAASERFAEEEGCTVEWSKIWSIEPISFDPRLIEFCDEAVRETAGVSHRLPSGPLHDAAEVARTGIPTVMMFTQSLAGLSHNKAEDTKVEDLKLAVQAFDRLARKTMKWLERAGESKG